MNNSVAFKTYSKDTFSKKKNCGIGARVDKIDQWNRIESS